MFTRTVHTHTPAHVKLSSRVDCPDAIFMVPQSRAAALLASWHIYPILYLQSYSGIKKLHH